MKDLNVVGDMSGCELSKRLGDIGVDNIKKFVDSDSLLSEYSDEELLDHLTNCDGRNLRQLMIEIFDSHIILGSDDREELLSRLSDVLDEVVYD